MADITELERRANQYITEHVANGGKREEVLADWIKSENPELAKYAKSILVQDLNPNQAAAEARGDAKPPTNQPDGSSYVDIAKGIAPVIGPAALASAAVATGAYYLGKKKGQGVPPPVLSDFETKKQQLELERMQAQVDVERARAARLTQMANKGQSLETQAKFSEPTAIEVAADTTSVKVPSPATIESEISKTNPLGQTNLTPEDLQARAAQTKAALSPATPDAPVATPLSAAPADAPAPMPSAQPKSFATETIVDEVKDMIQKTPDQPSMQAVEAKAPKGSVKPPLSPEQAAMKMPIGVGSGDNWLFNTLGPEKYSAFIDDVNGGRPFGNQYSAAQAAYQAYYPGPKLPGNIAKERNIARPPKNFGVIPPSMETVGPPTAQVAESLKKPVKPPKGQTGSMSAGQALNLLGNALGIAGLAQSFKQGQKTGDYSDFGMGAIGQILGNIAPKAGVAFSLMAPSSTNEGEQEALRDIAYRQKVGAGRGTTPASAYQR